MNNLPQIFNYQNNQIRVVMLDGQPWWVAKDVCDILNLSNTTEAIRALDDDEKSTLRISEGGPEVNIVKEELEMNENDNVTSAKELTLKEILQEQSDIIFDLATLVGDLDDKFNGSQPIQDGEKMSNPSLGILEISRMNTRRLNNILRDLSKLRNQL